MKRDPNLIRAVLLVVEAAAQPVDSRTITVYGYTREEIEYHISLLVEADYLTGIDVVSYGDRYHWVDVRLTWEGHDFLDAARSDTVWAKATSTIGQQVGSTSIEILKAMLVSVTKGMMGLP
jgi:hypothetical protein